MIFHIYRIPSHIYTHIDIYIYIFTYAHIYISTYICAYIYTLNSRMKDPWVNELPAMLGVRFLQTPAPPAAPPARALPAEDHGIDLECSGWIFLYNYIYIPLYSYIIPIVDWMSNDSNVSNPTEGDFGSIAESLQSRGGCERECATLLACWISRYP